MNVLTNYWHGLSPALRRYYCASAVPCLLFLALVVAHEWATRQPGLAEPLRIAFALAPVLGLAWLFFAYLRFLRECDELERRIELAATAWAGGIALQGAMACLFLLDARLIDRDARHATASIAMLLAGSYALVRAVLHRRYR